MNDTKQLTFGSCVLLVTHGAHGVFRARVLAPLLLVLLCFGISTHTHAQNGRPRPNDSNAQANPPQSDDDERPDNGVRGDGAGLTRQLDLTREQVDRIRAIRAESEAARRQLTQQTRIAQRNLDRAIYFEDADETVVEQRARELAQAQAAQARMRALTELKIRRVLTSEQLNTYRQLRRRFNEQRERRLERRGGNALGNNDAGNQRNNNNDTPRQSRPPRLRGMRGDRRNNPRP